MEGTIESDSCWKGTSRKALVEGGNEMASLTGLTTNHFDDSVDFHKAHENQEEKSNDEGTKLSINYLEF